MARRRLDATAYTVAWLCALPVELAAAQVMLDEEHLPHHTKGSAQYTLGRIGIHNVVLVCLPAGQMGIGPAAFSAGQAKTKFGSISFSLIVGVGGGVPSTDADVRLGDVVVSQPVREHGGVLQYDHGKTEAGGRMRRIGSLNAPPQMLLHAVAQLKALGYQNRPDRASFTKYLSAFDRNPSFNREHAGPDILFKSSYHHRGGATCESCSKDSGSTVQRAVRKAEGGVIVHYGTIASGNQVIKDGATRDRLSKELGGVLCFEMEAAGLMNGFPSLVVRGICDYADSHKNKAWQPYAAATAAACAKAILSLVPAAEEIIAAGLGEARKYCVPFSLKSIPIGKFAERPKDTQVLEQALLQQENEKGRRLLAAYGLGGVGKTQLAANFARRYQHKFSSVLWLDGSSESSLRQSFAAFASRIPTGEISEASRLYGTGQNWDLDGVVRDVLGWLNLKDNSNWLLVVDNVDRDERQREEDAEAYDVEEYLPEADHGAVLITTRLHHLGQLGERWEVKKVDIERAQAIFKTWYGKGVGREGDELLGLLDGLPLALAQAAAYMSETDTGISTYTQLYKKQWRRLMETHGGRHMPLRSDANGSVATTWTISYMAVRARNRAAANLLLLWAHLDNKNLWYEMLASASKESVVIAGQIKELLAETADSEIEFIDAIRTLRSYSLVEEKGQQVGYSMHPVVHQWALYEQDSRQQAELSRLAVVLVGLAVPSYSEKSYWVTQAGLLPHAERCRKSITRESIMELRVIDEASQEEEEAVRTQLWAVQNLGDLYSDQGKLSEAEEMYTWAWEGKRRALGECDISTLATANNLANLYKTQGKLIKAEEMYVQALEGMKQQLGEEDMSILNIVNNLGNLYHNQNNLDKAEVLYTQALEGKVKTLGEDHPSTLHTINNLGVLYKDRGKLDKAEEMYLQALNGSTKALGEDHTSTLDIIDNLGLLYSNQGKTDKAEEMYEQALKGRIQTLGEEHISTLHTLHHLGILYGSQGKLGKAEEMFVRALQGYNEAVGHDGTSTYVPALNTMWALGMLHDVLGHIDQAKAWYSKALQGNEKVFGEDNVRCQSVRDDLAALGSTDMDGDVVSETIVQQRGPYHEDAEPRRSRAKTGSRRQRVLRKLSWART